MNRNKRIAIIFFYGNNYKDQAYYARMEIGGAKRLGYIDGRIGEPSKKDPNIQIGILRIS